MGHLLAIFSISHKLGLDSNNSSDTGMNGKEKLAGNSQSRKLSLAGQ